LGQGDLVNTTMYLWAYGLVTVEQGDFNQTKEIIERLFQIGDSYGYIDANLGAYGLKTNYLIKRIDASEVLVASEQVILCTRENGTELQEMAALGIKAEALSLLGEMEASDETLNRAGKIYKKQRNVFSANAPPYLVGRFVHDINQLQKEILSKTPSNIPNTRRNAYRSGKAALKNSRIYAPYRTKIYRLMGLYYWLIGRQGKALKWWDRTIQEGERLGARPDLSRTYMEVGKRLLEPQSRYKELNGISPQEYLNKAEILFREMDLKWDLEQLDRIRAGYLDEVNR
jgi:tetratricopeptide (TPR) repeat protein